MAFEAILSQQRSAPSRWRRITLTFSVLIHVIALAVGVAHSIWQVEEMAMPAIEVTLAVAPPPPPPPPPPKRSSSTKPKTKPVESKPKVLMAPKDTPKEAPEEEAAEEESGEEEEGEDGGQEGGVVGGVIGGIVGGTAAPPPPASTGPKILSQGAGHRLLAINPNVRPYKVLVDEELFERQDSYRATLRICVSAQGTVTSVKILRPSIPPIDHQIPTVIPRWKYKPYLLAGKPTPFCYPLLYTVR